MPGIRSTGYLVRIRNTKIGLGWIFYSSKTERVRALLVTSTSVSPPHHKDYYDYENHFCPDKYQPVFTSFFSFLGSIYIHMLVYRSSGMAAWMKRSLTLQ